MILSRRCHELSSLLEAWRGIGMGNAETLRLLRAYVVEMRQVLIVFSLLNLLLQLFEDLLLF
jgi:hypothetical protein